jgi:hypothetical protein
MASLLVMTYDDKMKQNAWKTIHNKTRTHLKKLVDEVHEDGKYVFRNNKNRLKGYSSLSLRQSMS